MSILNAVLRAVFDAALYPFRGLHPLVGLTLVSLIFGVFALLVFKWTSDQEKIERVKNKIYAGLFEIRLFNDNLRAIFRAMFEILRHNLTYMRLSLIPLFVMLVPLVLVVIQLQFHYGYEGLEPGDTTHLKVVMKNGWRGERPAGDEMSEEQWRAVRPDVRLGLPKGLRVEAGPVWAYHKNELVWRIAAEEWGDYDLVFDVGGQRVTKSLQVSHGVIARRSTVRPASFLDQILYPAEPPLPGSLPIAKITVDYPPADGGVGWHNDLAWLGVFFVLSVIFAFALKKPLGVTL